MSVDATGLVDLGRTGLEVSRLGLGGAPLATLFWGNTEEGARSTVERALSAGIRLFDTAPLYGLGESERRIGAVLADTPRDRFVLTTKVGRLIRTGDGGAPEAVFDFSHDAVMRSLEESLERLQLDRVDIVHIHDPDDHLSEALSDTFPALEELREQGVISAISAGANHPHPLTVLVREADLDAVLLAGRYTLLDQTGLDELLPGCLQRGVAVMAAGVFNSGVLADPSPGAWYDYAPAPPEVLDRVRALASICTRYDVPIQAAALQFPLAHPAVTCVVVGMSSASQVDDNKRLCGHEISAEMWKEVRSEGLLDERAPLPSDATAA